MICYGRGINSLAGQLKCSPEEAQKIYDEVLNIFTGLRQLKEDSEKMAREKGYVTTAWGRRRRLPDMQLPEYTISYTKERIARTGIEEVSPADLQYYGNALSNIRSRKERDALLDGARAQGISIRNNNAFIARANRQTVNARIQGCLSGDTKILVEGKGICNIEDLVDTHIKLWDGEKYTNGDVVYSGKKQKCIITLNNGQKFICSPDHKFKTVNNRGNYNFKKCSELKPFDRLPLPTVDAPDVENHLPKFALESKTEHAHNFLDYSFSDIEDSYKCGQLLGRLASDGSYKYHDYRSSGLVWMTAEHEFEINDYLADILKPFNPNFKMCEVREGRNQRMSYFSKCSTQLTWEAEQLDIKHQIHPALWANTKLLKGFISGMYDGDGTVILHENGGGGISLKFGKQYNFEPMIRDIQKALLFFGIRAHCHLREMDSDLGIRKYDCQRFANTIGFINSKKQRKAENIKTVHDEHVFGRCLTVRSIEIIDEYIDMYDVCNTDSGYYIADGLIVHNSAADMVKIAMVKLANDEELKKLGFRMLLQVHDELIGECPYENRHAAAERFGYVMSHAVEDKMDIPFSTDVSCVFHWYDDVVNGVNLLAE